MRTKSASAVRREQAAEIRQGRIARITVATIAAILIPVFFYSLVQNRSLNRLQLSGIATTARVTKKERILDQWWSGRPIDEAMIRFKYRVPSGETYEAWQKVSGSSVANLSHGDQFTVWYDRSCPNRVLTPWNDGRGAVEIRITAFILSLLISMVAVFVTTRARVEAVKD
jgi:Protein of unknown function (DUF3592)